MFTIMKPCIALSAALLLLLSCSVPVQTDDKEWEEMTGREQLELLEEFKKSEEWQELEEWEKEMMEESVRGRLETEKNLEQFRLFNGCMPLRILVEELGSDAEEIGLHKEAIQNVLEIRLRGARLFNTTVIEDPTVPLGFRVDIEKMQKLQQRAARLFPSLQAPLLTTLYTNINVVGPAFSIRLAHHKQVTDKRSGVDWTVATWHIGSTGTHGGHAGYILNTLGEHVDQFLIEFLRVNEAACETGG